MYKGSRNDRLDGCRSEGKIAALRPKPDYNETIEVVVGKDGYDGQKRFTAIKSIICECSPFVEATCSERWSEAMKGVIALPDYRPFAFEAFLHWMYTEEVDLAMMVPNRQIRFSHIGHFWSLAHYLQCFDLCNQIFDIFIWGPECDYTSPLALEDVAASFESLPEGSKIRQFAIDSIAAGADEELYNRCFDWLPVDVVFAILKKFAKLSIKVKASVVPEDLEEYYEQEWSQAS